MKRWIWAALGFVPAAAGVTLAVRQFAPVSVASASELSRVGFGWPIAWTVQDQSATFSPVRYPTTTWFVSDRRGSAIEPPPTVTDWGLFAVDSLIVWAGIVAAAVGATMMLRRRRDTAS